MPEHELTPECRSIVRQSAALAGLGVFIVEMDTERCLYCSEQLARLHGLTGERGTTRIGDAEHLERIHPDDRERYRAALAEARGEAGRYEVDYRMYDAAGGLLYVVVVFVVVVLYFLFVFFLLFAGAVAGSGGP